MEKILEKVRQASFSKISNLKWATLFLIIIFILTFTLRLYYIGLTDNFSNEAYFSINQIESILETGKPLSFDNLSYSGRLLIVSPLFYYIIAFFNLVVGSFFSYKILPALFISSTVFIVFLLSMKLTKSRLTSIIAALISAFIPIQFDKTLNALSPHTLAILLFFLMLYLFIGIEKHKSYVPYLVVLSIILPLISPIAFLFVLTLMFYLILMFTESIKVTKLKKEIILFSTFMILLIEFIIYKKAFLTYGFSVIWGNMPKDILSNYFVNINIITSLVLVGILPLLLGIIGFYYNYRSKKTETNILMNASFLSILFLLLLKLINLSTGLIFLGIILSIFSSIAIAQFFKYLKITKLSQFEDYFFVAIFILVFILSVIPVMNTAKEIVNYSIADIDILDFEWLNKNTPEDTIIFAPYEYGYAIKHIAKRGVIMDANFLMASDVDDKYNDAVLLYGSNLATQALIILNKYGADYLYVPKDIKKLYKTKGLKFLENEKCFKQIKKGLYQITC